MIRPGTRAISGCGRKWAWSAPIGHHLELVRRRARTARRCPASTTRTPSGCAGSGGPPSSAWPRTHTSGARTSRRRQLAAWARSRVRSTVMGWWQVPSSGQPSAITPRRLRPKVWLSWTMSNSPGAGRPAARRTRQLNVRGSGNPAVHMRANSATSIRERNSHGMGIRKGSGWRYRSRLGTGTKPTPVVEHGPGLAGEDRHLVAQVDQLPRQVPGVHALSARVGVPSVDQEGNPKRGGPGHELQTVVAAQRPVKLITAGAAHRIDPTF